MIRLVGVALLLGLAAPAFAAPGAPACDGQLVGMRVSKLKPGGSMAGFADAVRDNGKWYASHGFKNDRVSTVPVYELADGTYKPSVTKAMSIHVYGGSEAPKPDAAWEAFVAKYKANSTIESEVKLCLPKGATFGK